MATREEKLAFIRSNMSTPDGSAARPPATTREGEINFIRSKQSAPTESQNITEAESIARGVVQGVSYGFADEAAAVVETLWEKAKGDPAQFGELYKKHRDESRANFEAARKANPVSYGAGEVAGGVGSSFVPGLGVLNAGRAVGAAGRIGRAALQGGASGVGFSDANTASGVATAGAAGAAIGGTLGGVGSMFGFGKARPRAGLTSVVDETGNVFDQGVAQGAGQDVARAAQRLGVSPTKAMVTDDYITQGLEKSLAVSPTKAGDLVRASQERAMSGIRKATGEMLSDRTDNTAFEIGESVIDSVKDRLMTRYEPIKKAYEEIATHTTEIALKDKSKSAVARNMAKYASESFAPGTPQRGMMLELSDRLANAKTVDQVKQIRTSLRNQIGSLDPRVRHGFGPIMSKLDRLERNSILRAAVEATGKQGEGTKLAQDLINKSKGANKAYRELMDVAWKLGDRTKVSKSRTVTELLMDLDNMAPEQVGQKLFRANDQKLLGFIQKEFPESFELMRVQKLNDIYSKSLTDGSLMPRKLIREIEKFQPEVRKMLFGDKIGKLEDLKKVARAYPGPINPSGTSINQQFNQIWQPIVEAKEMARYGLYKSGVLPTVRDVTDTAARAGENATSAAIIPTTRQIVSGNSSSTLPAFTGNELDRDSGVPANYRVREDEY